jgi:hypothetical protein
MTKLRAVAVLLVLLVFASLVSAAPLQSANRNAVQPGSASQSILSCLQVLFVLMDADLLGMLPPVDPLAGIVER